MSWMSVDTQLNVVHGKFLEIFWYFMNSKYCVVLCIWCNLKGLLVTVFSVFSLA